MVVRNHNNRSEKRKGHVPDAEAEGAAEHNPAAQGHQGDNDAAQRSRAGTDPRNDGRSPQNGGGDGAGGAPRQQGQGRANKQKLDGSHPRGQE